jgi:hypothetical protein
MPSEFRWAGIADAGELQQLRRVDGAAGQDHFTGGDLMGLAVAAVGDAGGHVALEVDLGDEGPGQDGQVLPAELRPQVGAGGGEPLALVDVAVERGEALLAVAVDVVGQRVAGFLCGGEEGLEQRIGGGTALQHQRAGVSAQFIVGIGCERVFHPVEVREAVREVPRFHAGVGAPALVVERVSALEDHAVDGAGAAQHLATGMGHAAAAHVRLGIGFVAPVIERVAAGEGQRGGHLDEKVPGVVASSGFKNQDAALAAVAQAVGEHGTRASAADDDVVVIGLCHAKSPSTWCRSAFTKV